MDRRHQVLRSCSQGVVVAVTTHAPVHSLAVRSTASRRILQAVLSIWFVCINVSQSSEFSSLSLRTC